MGSVPGKTKVAAAPDSGKNAEQKANHKKFKEAVDAGQYGLMNGFKQDTRCPLSERELYHLNKSWKAINREILNTALNMFIRLFETNKDLQGYFTMLNDVSTIADMRASKAFQTHALSVMCAIDDIIANLDDMDYVVSMVGAVVDSHVAKIDDFDFSTVWKVKEPFLMAMRETLGDRFTISIETVYTKTLEFLLTAVESAGNKYQADRKQKSQNGDLEIKNLETTQVTELTD